MIDIRRFALNRITCPTLSLEEFFRLAGSILDGRPDIAMYEELDGKR